MEKQEKVKSLLIERLEERLKEEKKKLSRLEKQAEKEIKSAIKVAEACIETEESYKGLKTMGENISLMSYSETYAKEIVKQIDWVKDTINSINLVLEEFKKPKS